jgi:predicted Na+-dependent transporter
MSAVLVIALSVASTLAAGLACELAGLRRALANRVTWAALACNLVVVPLIAWLVMPSLVAGPALVGLLLVAAAPGGGIGPLLALLGRGDATLAGALFLVLSLAGTVVALAITLVLDTRVADVLRAAGFVAASAIAPLVVGLIVKCRAPGLARLVLPWTSARCYSSRPSCGSPSSMAVTSRHASSVPRWCWPPRARSSAGSLHAMRTALRWSPSSRSRSCATSRCRSSS